MVEILIELCYMGVTWRNHIGELSEGKPGSMNQRKS